MQKNQSSRSIGDIGEAAVCGFLRRNGYETVKRNFTVRGGEIDIIARKNDTLAFVEVKTRSEGSLQEAELAVNEYKRQHIIRTAEMYIGKNPWAEQYNCRFDVAAVTLENGRVKSLRYYAGAFDASKK